MSWQVTKIPLLAQAVLSKLRRHFERGSDGSPPQQRRGGCAIQKKLRSHLNSRRRGSVVKKCLFRPRLVANVDGRPGMKRPILYNSKTSKGACRGVAMEQPEDDFIANLE